MINTIVESYGITNYQYDVYDKTLTIYQPVPVKVFVAMKIMLKVKKCDIKSITIRSRGKRW